MKDLDLKKDQPLVKHSCGLYVQQPPEWAIKEFRQDSKEKGDIITNTCRKIINDNDFSDWAYNAMVICAELLFLRKRWPNELSSYLDATNVFQYELSKWLYKRGITPLRMYRTQTYITRDPLWYYYSLCVHLNRIQFIEEVKPPVFSEWRMVYRPILWAWRKSLITGKRSWLYELLEREPNHPKPYVNRLRYFRSQAYQKRVNKGSETT